MQGGVNFRWFKIIRLLDQVFRADASLRFPRKKIFEEMWRSPDWGNYQGKMIILSGENIKTRIGRTIPVIRGGLRNSDRGRQEIQVPII